jgi:hypothetical protein
VNKSRLSDYYDVIVFAARGTHSLASDLGGGGKHHGLHFYVFLA